MSIHAPVVCPDCRGEGWQHRKQGGFTVSQPCDFCGGTGWVTAFDIEYERARVRGWED